jgi:hypothetical protein
MKNVSITIGKKPTDNYENVQIIKAHENSFDIRTANNEIIKFVKNITSSNFVVGDYVSIVLSNDKKTARIIGSGKKLGSANNIKKVKV